MENTEARHLMPSYVKDFKCIGGTCEDTCCAGWYIAIDEATYKKYKKVKDPTMKKRLDKELVAKKGSEDGEHVAKIKLKNNRCAFLSKEGWCDIYSNLGEKYLSNTCTLYPRTINQVDQNFEYSIALSCPEAARLVLLQKDPITFVRSQEIVSNPIISSMIQYNSQKPKKWQDYFHVLREHMIAIIQDRNYTLEERFMILEDFIKKLQLYSVPTSIKRIPSLLEEKRILQKRVEAPMLGLINVLVELRTNKKWPSSRYEVCYEAMLQGLGWTIEKEIKDIYKAYEEGYKKYYIPFMLEKEYLLENYFVHYIFERVVPLDGISPMESFKVMKLYEQLIKLHLVGMAKAQKGLSEEDVLQLIQSFSKVFDHNPLYHSKLLKEIH